MVIFIIVSNSYETSGRIVYLRFYKLGLISVVCVWHQRRAFQPKLARMSVDRMSYFALVIALVV